MYMLKMLYYYQKAKLNIGINIMAGFNLDFGGMGNTGNVNTRDPLNLTSQPLTGDGSAGGGGGSFWDSLSGFGDSSFGNMLLGGKDQPGLLGLGMDLFTNLKSFGLMEDQLEQGQENLDLQRQFGSRNLTNQAMGINAMREDKAQAEASGLGLSGQAKQDYINRDMNKNRLDVSGIG